jgi:imidazolonepropionase-like amidohydrolase
MGSALRVSGTVFPEQDRRDIWIADGMVVDGPVDDADLVAEGWVLPGLVDAHCHVGLDANGAVPDDVAEQQALTDRAAGVLLMRDAGSAADTRWIDDRDDLPRIIRAGRHIARTKRYIRNYAHEIEPAELSAYVEREARRGDGWVKLVGDWIDRDVGDLAPCWPFDALQSAIAVAHANGARVTAHVFGEEALGDLINAGIDCIEHGSGLQPDTVALMAERGVALVPTVVQLGNFPEYAAAGEERFPQYAAHMRALYERRFERIRAAWDAGLPVYAGTDAGGVLPHGLIGAEIAELTRYGLPAIDAIAAGSWKAREWLGRSGSLVPGVDADLVVYPADPVADPDVLTHPSRIILRGAVVS